MLISKKKRALVLKLRDPHRVTSLIPKSKIVHYKGQQLVAVKHGVDEVKVLNNIGISAPSPIKYYYDWPGRFSPFMAQRETAGFLTMNRRAFVLNGMGTGKTLGTLWAYDYLRSIGILHKAIVVTPLSTLERTWADEVFNHFPHLTVAVLHGSRDKRLAMLEVDADIYLVNHDGVKVDGLVAALAERADIDLVIVDELAQVARNQGTDRYKALNEIVNKQVPRWAWGLTGTPIPNEPTDAWAQCKLLVPERVPGYFRRFKESVMRQVTQLLWVPRANALDLVNEAMQPAIRFRLEDCVDLPPCVFQHREVPLTPTQNRAYRDMFSKLKAEVKDGSVLAVNEAVKAQKLIQISCGIIYGEEGVVHDVDAKPRLEVVREVVEEAGTKVIVFVPFVAVVGLVSEYLKKAGFSVECIHGGVSKTERDRIFGAFQKGTNPKVLVAQPAAMSHGLTLTAASTIVWYAPITSNDVFDQATARIIRPGQKFAQLVVMIQGTDIETKYYKRLQHKQKVQGVLLDMVRDSNKALVA